MAVLEKIRSRIGILVSVVIGISLLAFILTDFLGKGKSVLGGKEAEVAQIAGQSVNIREFEEKVKNLTDIYKFQTRQSNLNEETLRKIREQTWQELVDDIIMNEESDKLGLEVSNKELIDMMQGANPHPLVRYLFTNPETKEFDRSALVNFARSLNTEQDPARKAYWLFIENQIRRERLLNKFNSLIKHGMFVTSSQLEADSKDQSKKVNFSFIAEMLTSISDSLIKAEKTDIENYYKKHKSDFEQQEATRSIEYITYDIKPSQEDYQAAEKWINNIKPDFEASTEIKQFVNLNSDTSFTEKYFKQKELSDTLKKFMFSAKQGATFGPYFENNTFKIARLADIKDLPDTVRASQILIRPKAQTEEAVKNAEKLADSLKNVLKKGGNFAELAKTYSDDPSSVKVGGDLGWFKEDTMPKLLSNACFFGKKGDISVVKGTYGFQVVKITDRGKEVKKVQIGIVERKVEPSNITIQGIYQKASTFAGNYNTGDRFETGIKKMGLSPKSVVLNETMTDVPGLINSRELIRWAFGAELNTLSDIKQLGDKFIIARLSQIKDKGFAPISQVQNQIIIEVKKEKKAEQLAEKIKKEMKGAGSIDEIATRLNVPVLSAADINFNSYYVPNAGYEPALIATALNISPNKISDPVKGNNGVYLVYVTDEKEESATDPKMLYMRLNSFYASRINYELMASIRKLADIKDKRIKFY